MCTATGNYAVQRDPALVVVRAHRGGAEVIDNLADEWRRLCAKAADDQPFYRPEWIRAHIRAFSPDATIVLITARSNDRLHLVLPLLEEKNTFCKVPVRRLRAPVDMHCGRFDATRIAGSDGDAAILATWNFLRNLDNWDMLQLNYAQKESAVSRLASLARDDGFRTVLLPERPSPYIQVPFDSEPSPRMPPNSKLRSQLRQVYAKLEHKGTLRLECVRAADPQALDRFYRLEAGGWKGIQGTAIICDPSKKQFFDEIAHYATIYGYFSLYMLEWNDQLLAAHFALVLQGRCYSPKVAYDERFRQFAPGHLIVDEILKDCAARRIRVFDITGEDEEWKMKWTNKTSPVSHHLVFRGSRGDLAHTLGLKLKPAICRLLPSTR